MRRPLSIRVGLVGLALLGMMIVPQPAAQACSCAMGSDKLHWNWADAVFVGEVVDERGDAESVVYTLEVDRVYKGEVSARQEVATSTNSASCGTTLPEEGPVLVFGSVENSTVVGGMGPGQLGTSMCSGSGSSSVPASYGPGEPPIGAETVNAEQTSESTLSTSSRPDGVIIAAVTLSAVLLGLGAVYLVRKRRPAGW